jgi:hypothetical protein
MHFRTYVSLCFMLYGSPAEVARPAVRRPPGPELTADFPVPLRIRTGPMGRYVLSLLASLLRTSRDPLALSPDHPDSSEAFPRCSSTRLGPA